MTDISGSIVGDFGSWQWPEDVRRRQREQVEQIEAVRRQAEADKAETQRRYADLIPGPKPEPAKPEWPSDDDADGMIWGYGYGY